MLTVEDGTIVADADSYISAEDAATYHAARGNTAWAALTGDAPDQHLRKATDYMGQVYGLRWKGYRVSETQVLDWPREEVVVFGFEVDTDVVPDAVRYACAELALRSVAGTLLPDTTRRTIREKVGPIEVEYDKNSPLNPDYQAIDNLLAPYLRTTSGIFRDVVRA